MLLSGVQLGYSLFFSGFGGLGVSDFDSGFAAGFSSFFAGLFDEGEPLPLLFL